MNQENLVLFGKITKTHGNKGALVIKQDNFSKQKLKKTEPLFVDIQPTAIPFFIEELTGDGNNLFIVKFEFIDKPEDAARLCGLNVLIKQKKAANSKELNPVEIVGYSVIDENLGDIGKITDIIEMPQQILLQIEYKGKEILIPAIEEFISDIDHKSKSLKISAPDGLINLYLD